MISNELLAPLAGAVALGAVHGVEPGHGWPVAASYALDQANKWAHGLAASLIIGVGHLISSLAMVGAFFYAKGYFNLTQGNDPITILNGVQIGGPVSVVAGVLLVGLGVREYFHGHAHGEAAESHDHAHDHNHDDGGDGHSHDIDHDDGGGGHSHDTLDDAADRGLLGIAWFAFVLGFAHEEEFEIIALCAGSNHCLELMSAYALTVIGGIVGLTLLLIAGYHRSKERVERYTPYLPVVSAAVLILMGLGFVGGLF